MIIYELFGRFGDYLEDGFATYGFFSSYEKAEKLQKQFEALDCDEDFDIYKYEIDHIDNWVVERLNYLKEQFEEES